MSQNTIQTLLYSVGIFRHYCGYTYLQEAAMLAAEKPARLHCIQKEIYYPIAKKYNTTIHSVEKNIRTVRDILIQNGGGELLAEVTGYAFWRTKRPYPKELIGVFAELLSMED